MERYDKLYNEIYAVVAINTAYPNSLEHVVKGEHPDWQDVHLNTGLEVVRAMTPHMGYVIRLWNRYHSKDIKSIPLKNREGFKGEYYTQKGKLVGISDNKGLIDGTRHILLSIEAAKKKLELLNSPHFLVFKNNEIFIYVSFTINDSDLNLFLELYVELASQFKKQYSAIYLFDNFSLYRIFAKDTSFDKFEYTNEQCSSMKQDSFFLRDNGNWDTNNKFKDNYQLLPYKAQSSIGSDSQE